MLTRDKRINELEAQVEHLQDRLDNLRDDFETLEAQVEHSQDRLDNLRDDFETLEYFVTKKFSKLIDDRFNALDNYLNIEFNREIEKNVYTKKPNTNPSTENGNASRRGGINEAQE